ILSASGSRAIRTVSSIKPCFSASSKRREASFTPPAVVDNGSGICAIITPLVVPERRCLRLHWRDFHERDARAYIDDRTRAGRSRLHRQPSTGGDARVYINNRPRAGGSRLHQQPSAGGSARAIRDV